MELNKSLRENKERKKEEEAGEKVERRKGEMKTDKQTDRPTDRANRHRGGAHAHLLFVFIHQSKHVLQVDSGQSAVAVQIQPVHQPFRQRSAAVL
jgi:hypothetical protein